MPYTIEKIERLDNSRNGNPTWRLRLSPPDSHISERERGQYVVTTATDTSEAYALGYFVEGRQITDLQFDKRGRLYGWRIL